MKLTQNQYYGHEHELPSILKKGSLFFAIDTVAVYVFNEGDKPMKIVSNEYTAEITKAVRMTISPYKLVTYLPSNIPYTTPVLSPGVPTRVLIPTTVKSINSFGVVDLGGGVLAYQFQGAYPAIFEVSLSTGLIASTNNTVLTLEAYKNGAIEPGLSSIRKLSNADVGNMTITGEVSLNPLDNISIYVNSSLSSSVTFSRASIQIVERN